MKLNMGCGYHKASGYINVDVSPVCAPDQLVDLEVIPWPWADNSTEEVVFFHCLEHLGRDPRVFLAMFKELYRICRNDALIKIVVPHPRHDNFINDPTHVRAITPNLLALFSRQQNDHWKQTGAANTPLAHQLGVDFNIVSHTVEFAEPYRTQFRDGVITEQELKTALREKNNIATEFRVELKVRKEASPTAAELTTALLFEPEWNEPSWKAILLSYLDAFSPGEPVALVFPLNATITLEEAEGMILDLARKSGREVFPNVVLVGHQENLIETLREYAFIQWVPVVNQEAGPLAGSCSHRLAQARKRLSST